MFIRGSRVQLSVTLALVLAAGSARGQIFRWTDGQLIPGTGNISVEPGVGPNGPRVAGS